MERGMMEGIVREEGISKGYHGEECCESWRQKFVLIESESQLE